MGTKVFELLPCTSLEGSISETPPIPLQLKFINHIKSHNDAKHVAAQNVNNSMIPPALLEIV